MKTFENGSKNALPFLFSHFKHRTETKNGKAENENGPKKYGVQKQNNSDGNTSETVGNLNQIRNVIT